ncbi:hypothetical protein L6164_024911 [Bauhinia variegata]|uniref:Uncharacterized protein n=1 Tax=Bauhinia variegata TaxID=167791 RepID=A0ACB9M1G8_BAUVA|nr:hypothetical protein L6164_024911 [Bauhinia variegata]
MTKHGVYSIPSRPASHLFPLSSALRFACSQVSLHMETKLLGSVVREPNPSLPSGMTQLQLMGKRLSFVIVPVVFYNLIHTLQVIQTFRLLEEIIGAPMCSVHKTFYVHISICIDSN